MHRRFVSSVRWTKPAAVFVGLALLLLAARTSAAPAEQSRAPKVNYAQATKFSREYLQQFVYDSAVTPHWIGKTESFWYSFKTSKGTRYWKVNAQLATKEPLFDHEKLATAISEQTRKPVDPTTLVLNGTSMNDEGTKFKFVVGEFQYEYEIAANKMSKLGKAPPPAQGGLPPGFEQMTEEQRRQFLENRGRRNQNQNEQERREEQQQDEQQRQQQENQQTTQPERPGGPGNYKAYSPDKKRYAYVYKYNLYLAEEGKENEAIQLTKDGVEDYTFASGFGGFGGFRGRTENQNQTQTQTQTDAQRAAAAERKTRPQATWSSDSKAFHVTRTDSRGLNELYLVNSLATPRPQLEKYKYPMPGEPDVRKSELYHVDADAKKITRVKPKWVDERYSDVRWGKNSEELRFIRRDRLQRNMEYCTLTTASGEAKCLIVEGFENAHLEMQPVRLIDETEEMLWWSERSGWGHYYLYDKQGKIQNAVTTGTYRASRIEAVDAKNRLLFFRGNAREEFENVYYQHLYCVKLDGTGLTLMDPGNANHTSILSPSRFFVVDNYSRVDMAPASVLRDAKGNKVMDLEQADLTRLYETGWKMPETFVVKAADGVTDLYGNLWKPFDFDSSKKYPIIANVYPGPQQEGVTHTFAAISTTQQLAQLGFIVIQVGHRGGAATRSKAYGSFGYNNLRDYGLADKKAAIEQLAARFPFIDIDKVGIYGHSGGGFMSAAALLQKPYNDFFKAAVASAGNHDNNIYNDNWAERYHGLKEVIVKKEEKKTTTGGTATGGGGGGPGEDNVKQNGGEQKAGDAKQEGKTDEKKATTGEQKKTEEKKDAKADEAKEEHRFEIKVPTNAELAGNLKGALLLVHGEADNNVHPANTMRLADALIKANKRFDMLILPGKRHAFGDYQPYFTQRMWEFFADHLLDDRQAGADILEKRNR